jgi:hypothetical protein
MVGSMPSTPSAVVFSPISAARASPGESGTTPTIQTGSMNSLRIAFINRSVPMLPGPMIAAFTFLLILALILLLNVRLCQWRDAASLSGNTRRLL